MLELSRTPTSELEERLRERKEEKLHRMCHEKYRYFVPTGAGEDFIKLVFSGDNFTSLLSAANGIGKTSLGVDCFANLMFPCENPYFQEPLFKDWQFPKFGRIISDHTVVENTVVRLLKEYFPAGRYQADKAGRAFESKWKTDTGWEFDVMTSDQEVKEFEAATLGIVWLDELAPEAIYKACVARMRKGGIIFITATPLAGSAWLYDHFVLGKDKDIVGNRGYMEADIETACIDHGVRGFLDHDTILKMMAEWSEDEQWARAFGKFQHLTGMIFKRFNRQIHTIKPFKVEPRDYVVAERLDPHPRNPDAVTWIAIDKNGTHFVVDELYMKGTTGELAERIKAKASNYRIVDRKADPAAFTVDQHTGRSLAGELSTHGLSYQPASKDRTLADRMIGDYLDYEQVGDQIIRAPQLYLFDTCERSIWEMEHYRWDEWRGRTGESRDPKEKPVDRDDHCIENIGRALVDRITFTPQLQERYLGPIGREIVLDPYA